VSSLYSKISHPVLANLKLTTGDGVRLEEVYPPNLPDLFYGGQLILVGGGTGGGGAALKMGGVIGKREGGFCVGNQFRTENGGRTRICRTNLGPAKGGIFARSDSRQRTKEGIDG